MSETCDACGQVISKAETLEEIYAALKKFKSPHQWAARIDQPAEVVPNVGSVCVVEVSDNLYDDPGYDDIDIYMVFEVNGNRFYKVEGTKSSYDGTSWNPWMGAVSKQKREIYVYE